MQESFGLIFRTLKGGGARSVNVGKPRDWIRTRRGPGPGNRKWAKYGFGEYGFISWSRRYAERIWGESFILVRQILGKLPANFDGEF